MLAYPNPISMYQINIWGCFNILLILFHLFLFFSSLFCWLTLSSFLCVHLFFLFQFLYYLIVVRLFPLCIFTVVLNKMFAIDEQLLLQLMYVHHYLYVVVVFFAFITFYWYTKQHIHTVYFVLIWAIKEKKTIFWKLFKHITWIISMQR